MAATSLSPLSSQCCGDACSTCRSARRDTDDLDVLHLTPMAIVQAEMLAAVDALMDTFHTRG